MIGAVRLDLTSFTVGAVGASDIALYEWKPSSGVKAPKMRSSTQEGYGVRVLDPSSSATGTLTCGVTIEFTEET